MLKRNQGMTRRPVAAGDGADEPTDEVLLGRIVGGEPEALEMLYGRHKSMAFALATRITTDPTLAEDVLQEAFLTVWREAGRFSPQRASARTWLLAIVHHRAVDAVRRRRWTAQLPDADVRPPSLALPDVWPEVAGRLDREAIVAALKALPTAERQVIELAYFDGLTQSEIAARTGAPLGTVKSRARLGLLSLRARLEVPAVVPEAGR